MRLSSWVFFLGILWRMFLASLSSSSPLPCALGSSFLLCVCVNYWLLVELSFRLPFIFDLPLCLCFLPLLSSLLRHSSVFFFPCVPQWFFSRAPRTRFRETLRALFATIVALFLLFPCHCTFYVCVCVAGAPPCSLLHTPPPQSYVPCFPQTEPRS